jgi:hypothetical protein
VFTGSQWCLESLLKGKSKPSECAKSQTDQCARVVVKLRVAHGQGDRACSLKPSVPCLAGAKTFDARLRTGANPIKPTDL